MVLSAIPKALPIDVINLALRSLTPAVRAFLACAHDELLYR